MQSRPVDEPPALISPPADLAVAVTRMQALREATRSVHTSIEGVLPLLDRGLTRARYARVVEAFYGFYAPLEPSIVRALASRGATGLALEQRAKLPLLATDLRALGRTPAEIEALPRCHDLPVVDSASQAIGVLYVFEGATLGGQIIRKHLRTSLELDAASGAAFFAGYGTTTGAMWTQFVEHVNQATDVDTDAAAHAAVATFQTLTRWLDASLSAS